MMKLQDYCIEYNGDLNGADIHFSIHASGSDLRRLEAFLQHHTGLGEHQPPDLPVVEKVIQALCDHHIIACVFCRKEMHGK